MIGSWFRGGWARALVVALAFGGLSVVVATPASAASDVSVDQVQAGGLSLDQAEVDGRVRLTADATGGGAQDGLVTLIVADTGAVVASCAATGPCSAEVDRPAVAGEVTVYQARRGTEFSEAVMVVGADDAVTASSPALDGALSAAAGATVRRASSDEVPGPVTDVSTNTENGWTVTIGRQIIPGRWTASDEYTGYNGDHPFVATAVAAPGVSTEGVRLEIAYLDGAAGWHPRILCAVDELCIGDPLDFEGPQRRFVARVVTDVSDPVVVAQVDYSGWYDRYLGILLSGGPYFSAGETSTLTAEALVSPDVVGPYYAIYIQDLFTGEIVAKCLTNPCSAEVSYYTGERSYRAFLAHPSDPEQRVAVSTTGRAVPRRPWYVSGPHQIGPPSGATIPVGIYANQDYGRTGGHYRMYLVDVTANKVVKTCDQTSSGPPMDSDGWCYHRLSVSNGHVYVATVAGPGGPWDDVQASDQPLSTSSYGPMFSVPLPGGGSRGETSGGVNPSGGCQQDCDADPVNVVTGEYWDSVDDLGVAGALRVVRSYGSTVASADGPLGFGWSWNWGIRLEVSPEATGDTLAEASQVVVVQENGSAVPYTRFDDQLVAPARITARLTELDDGRFRFERHDGTRFEFSAQGDLETVADRNGNTVTVTTTAGRVTALTDDRGRSIDVSWSGGRITRLADHSGRTVAYEYDARGDLVEVTTVDGSTRGYGYDDAHRVTRMTDAVGDDVVNTYDESGRVVEQRDQLDRVHAFEYTGDQGEGSTTTTYPDGARRRVTYVQGAVVDRTEGLGSELEATSTTTYSSGRPVGVTDALGRTTTFTYDENGNRTSVTDPLGRTSTTTYDAFNNPLVVTNAAGEATTFTYDDRGNPLSMTDPTGAATTFTVNPDGTVATATDPTGGVTTYTYDAHGFVASVTGPDGAVVTTVRDALGRVEASTDPRGAAPGSTASEFTSTFTYDAAGRRLTSTDPLGAVVASAYDAAGRPTSVTDATGATTTTEYDAAGQVTAVVDAAGARTAFTYDGAGRVTSVTDASGAVTETAYDVLGRATAVTDPLGRVTRTEYDAGDRVVATVSPSGARTAYAYDDADQLLTVTDPKGKVTTTTYDRAGRPVTVTDADDRKVTTTYDRVGRPVKVLRADGSALLWEYDPAGRVTATVDAAGERTTYTYDAAGRRASATDTAGRTTTFGYDPAGLLTSLTQPDGAVTTYDHDAAGRRTATDYSDGTPDESTVYDLAGRPTAVTDGSGTTTYAYDAVGRVTRVAQGSTEVGYAWDAVGRLTDLTYPSGEQVRRAYDAAGQLTTVTDWADRVFTYTYDADGLTTEVAYPNGVTTDVDRDDAGQAVAMTTSANGIELLELAYGYTDAGLLADQTTTRSTQPRAPPASASTSSTYTWDGLARIAEVEGHGAGAFAFDAAGSVTTLADGRTLTYDAARQLQSLTAPATTSGGDPSTTTYSYDARGNRLAATTGSGDDAPSVEHVYDRANRLTSITTADGTATSYTYGPGGLRATATTGTVTERYTWDTLAGVPLLLTDATFAYVYGNGSVPLAQVDLADGDVDYLHTDTLGSVRSTTDTTGTVTSDADYDPYGRPEAPTSDPTAQVTRFGYAGEYTDPTGYLYLRARYYDPDSAQFLTRDPLEANTGNPYGYTDGNPLQFTDPLGLMWGDIGQGLLGALQGIGDVALPLAIGTHPIGAGYLGGKASERIHNAYVEGGFGLAINQINPVYSLLENVSTGWDLAQKGCVREASRALTRGVFDVAGLAAGGRGAMAARGAVRGSPAAPLTADALSLTATVRAHISDVAKDGSAARPYTDSRLTMQTVMDAVPPTRDPGGIVGGLRWDAPGAFKGSSGVWELVVDAPNKTVVHFLFRSDRRG